ncbi:TPA: HEAT repeat domain-containing protein [Candidatus Poribacteria bacterium]|nr:HEAT repeat domain-containing protein [Candidatus Poribacteria bacterium]
MISKDAYKKIDRFEERQQSIQDISQFSNIVHNLQSTSKNVRQEAARKLGELGVEDAVEPLLLALFDEEDVAVRIQIIEALSQLGTDEAIAGIMDMFDDPDNSVRRAAINTLRGIDSDEVIDELMYLANEDRDRSIRLVAIDALFQYEDEKVSQMLAELSSDPDPTIRDAIKHGIEQEAKIKRPQAKSPTRKDKGARRQRTKR